jgi:hypothetical protein
LLASLWPLPACAHPAAPRSTRLEAENRIANQAISTQDDKIEADDPFARAFWEEHRRRMASKIGALETGIPRSSLPQRDPWGMRVARRSVAVCRFRLFLFRQAGTPRPMPSSVTSSEQLPDVRIDAWITPPAYVNQAPVFLTGVERPQGEPVAAIDWQRDHHPRRRCRSATHRCPWGNGPNAQTPSNRQLRIRQPQPPRQVHRLDIQAGNGRRTEDQRRGSEENFAIRQIIPDAAPVAAFVETPRRAANGALELDYTLF